MTTIKDEKQPRRGRKRKGKSIYLKASDMSLITTALDHYNTDLQAQYEKSIEQDKTDEWYLETSTKIRDLLIDKLLK